VLTAALFYAVAQNGHS